MEQSDAAPRRCPWCVSDAEYTRYHDEEWGVPVYDSRLLFEFLLLEGAQAGLSWLTILKRRNDYRAAFGGTPEPRGGRALDGSPGRPDGGRALDGNAGEGSRALDGSPGRPDGGRALDGNAGEGSRALDGSPGRPVGDRALDGNAGDGSRLIDPETTARLTEKDVERLLGNSRIIRNRRKIEAFITNSRAYLALKDQGIDFAAWLWDKVDGKPIVNAHKTVKTIPVSTPLSASIAKELKQKGFVFTGPVTIYAYMQATGMINDHITGCFRYHEIAASFKENHKALLPR